ncbi:hypothetical protein [Halogeometricum limi]|uniref:Type I phosphodiesterase / nucleotide pyrophosphatase n=1 Tax=Halogeometricum limi TaxID=555875 RepID=A0A1I6HV44_9EURY|nr:hypothetical protein [Halogeometricum limi]SFR58304.1 hypothetical protein SAMN04488124_2495 [Halogeometricum limi]
MAKLEEVVDEAKSHPVVVDVDHPLSYLYLQEELELFESEKQFEDELDNPSKSFERNVAIKEPRVKTSTTYPSMSIDHDPLSPALNKIIGTKYEEVEEYLLTQRDIKRRILDYLTDESVVVLMIADGLGYKDVQGTELEGEPCLVNGPTITPIGYRNIVFGHDNKPIVDHLVKRGFMRRRGYSYWDKESYNDLNKLVFENFSDSELTRVRTSEEIISDLENRRLSDHRTFIQISRRALDGDAHDGKEVRESDINHEIKKLQQDIDAICEVLDEQVDSYLFILTADHGILWRKEFEPHMSILTTNGQSNMRYAKSKIGVQGDAKLLDAYGSTYTVFPYPFVSREFHHDEFGIHGGLSYEESLVPLLFRNSEDSE